MKFKRHGGKEATSDNDTNVLHDIPIAKLEQTVNILTDTTERHSHLEKFDYSGQYTKYKIQLAHNYDKVVQLQSKHDALNQSLAAIHTTDPVMIQLQNEKWCIQTITNAIKKSRPVYLNEYQTQYQNIVTQLKNMYDSFNQAQLTKKFSVSVFGKQVEFRKNLNYSAVHRWINDTFQNLKSGNARNQSIQLMFDNGTLAVNSYDELALFGIQLHGMVEKNGQILQQINNKIESKFNTAATKSQNVKNQLQIATQQLNQTYQLFFEKIKYMIVYRHSRAMQLRLTSRIQQIRTIMLKLECTAFVYCIMHLFNPNIHKVSDIAKLFDTSVNIFINGTHCTVQSPAFKLLNQTFNDNVLKKVSSVNQRTNIQLWKKEVVKSIESKTNVLFQELFSDENCKVLNEILTDGIDLDFMYLGEHLSFLLESARNKEYLSTMFNGMKFNIFNSQDIGLLPAISIPVFHFENNTTSAKFLILNVWDQSQDLPHGQSYHQLIDMHEKFRQEIDKNDQMLNNKLMVYLKSVNLAAAVQANDTSFQEQTDMIHWLFADDYGISELYKLVAIKAIVWYHHDKFANASTTNNNVYLMSDSEIMGVFYLVEQQLMMHAEQNLYMSTLQIAQQWYDVLNDQWHRQKYRAAEYITSLEARLVSLDL